MAETAAEAKNSHRDLTAFQRNILIVLAEEPRYGLAVKRELENYYGEEVNHGRLYPNLDSLVQEGLVEKSALDKRTNEYALTSAGGDVVRDQLMWTIQNYVADHKHVAKMGKIIDEQTH